jgi:hypothetical protein
MVNSFPKSNLRQLLKSKGKRIGDEVFILSDHERAEKRVLLLWLAHEHLNCLNTHELQLEPYGVAVITRAEKDGNK